MSKQNAKNKGRKEPKLAKNVAKSSFRNRRRIKYRTKIKTS